MKTYDAILVLGNQPDPTTWQFPEHTYKSLDKALELFRQGSAPCIVVSGDHALRFDNAGITQPFKEADKMEEYLLAHDCPPEAIVIENISKDTVANYYHLKNLVFIPRRWTSIIQVAPEYRVPRLEFLCQKVLGPDYTVDFQTVDFDDDKVFAHEAFILQMQMDYLKDMKDGDDNFLEHEFYDSPWYQYWKQREQVATTLRNPKD